MEPAAKFVSLLFIAGVLLLVIGSARSKDLKQHPFMPVWKADQGRNGILWAGTILTSGCGLILLLLEVF
jgi:hypothetical protein